MRNWAFWVFVLLLGSSVSAYAVDMNNNGNLTDDQFPPDPGTFVGNTDRDELVYFPTSTDTWNLTYYPYWWNTGDTVYGTHTVSMGSVTHADLTIYLTYNSLTPGCGVCNIDFRIAGTTVGSFQIRPESGLGPIYASFDFAPKTPPFELRYYETTTVAGGCGSISFDESGRNTVNFGGVSPAIETTWGSIKDLFQ
jgi:hypothetical protein